MTTVLTAVFLVCCLGLALWRLSPLHPTTLWCASWAAAGVLFTLDLLPYKPLSWPTALVICGGTAAFAVATLAGERLMNRGADSAAPQRHSGGHEAAETRALQRAALAAALLAALVLAAFLVQEGRKFGWSAPFVVSGEVRLDVAAGGASATVKYIYFALAGAALAALAAARVSSPAEKRNWLGLAVACVASTYFATGRSTIVLAAAIATLAYWLGRERLPSLRRVALAGVLLGALALSALVVIGELQGKTYENSALRGLPSAFSETRAIQPLALPYQYSSASFAALNEQVGVATTWGESHGCATASTLCKVLTRAGIEGVEARPLIRPFTPRPLKWNLYTALDLPLLDGGLVLALPIIGLTGFGFGVLWGAVRRRSTVAMLAYSVVAPTLLLAANQYGFLAPHILGGILIAVSLLLAGRAGERFRPGRWGRSKRSASPQPA